MSETLPPTFPVGPADGPSEGYARLYTTAMLAELVGAPAEAIKRWWRRGYLAAEREAGRVPYFAEQEVHVARCLADLLSGGSSLPRIDKLVAQLTAAAPEVERPLRDLAVVAEGGRLFLRRGSELAEPSGQLLIDFDEPDSDAEETVAIAFTPRLMLQESYDDEADGEALPASAEEARALAYDLQASGAIDEAIGACRAALFAGGDAQDHTLLAELLYMAGDASAARERYYVALELDETDVEARVSLGCLLVEEGELDLAAAAFRGAIVQQPGFADAHYHLARTLDDLEQAEAAERHWRRFLEVAPASPWVDEAADRLGSGEPPP